MQFKERIKYFLTGLIVGSLLFSTITIAAGTNISAYFYPIKYYFDGVEKTPPDSQKGFIYNGTTYVPLRFMAQSLGKEVGWDGSTYSVFVGKQPNISLMKDLEAFDARYESTLQKVTSFKSNTGAVYAHGYVGSSYTGQSTLNYSVGNYTLFEAVLAPSYYFVESGKNDISDIGDVKIYVNNRLVYSSGPIPSNLSQPKPIKIDLSNAISMTIELRSYNLGLLDGKFIEKF